MRAASPKVRASFSMLANGAGELSGTSMISNFVSISAEPIDKTSSGVIPRRMAMSGARRSRSLNEVI